MSRTYDVYGIGNALVDIQYRVDPAYLGRMGIEKGLMTLVDEERQQALIDSLQDADSERSSGGSAANTMIALAGLGGKGYYACKVGLDEYGTFYLADLEVAGVDTNPGNRAEGVTGKCIVLITPDADRTMNTFLGITGSFGPEQVEEDVIRESQHLYIEGYLLTSEVGHRSALAAQSYAKAHGTRVAVTLSDPSVVEAFRDRIDELVDGGVDLLFCNEDEAQTFTGTTATEDACAGLAARVGGFAVTCGAEGAIVGREGETWKAPGFAVGAVDTNGAGDAFAGAFLFGITHGYDFAQSAKLATYTSSRVVAKYGPRLDVSLSGEVERILGS
ncbi:MAG: adenosine kinase [Candidatus Latescibacteria bacterium]|jgi:sugar/nucleoside kinase (ribokinase family)|nr:adenosine kinase [Candidatus Latescibacterota bacterium]